MVANSATTLKFYNGNEIPIFGLGTWKVSNIYNIIIYNI